MNTILSGQSLVDTLREHCDQAKERIWIASPYIGTFKDVQKIIGGNWMRSHIDFRVLTDVESGFIRRDTYAQFKESPNTEIRSLFNLHAKIYLIDDWCLLTSANLTGMAFSARHEVGQVVSSLEQVVKLFDQWWKKAQAVSSVPKSLPKSLADREDLPKPKRLYKLPQYTSGASDQFLKKCDQFKEFASLYESITGRNQQMVSDGFTLYEEVDYFFNYLYHDHPDMPSKEYTKEVRSLTLSKVKQEIRHYFKIMSYEPGSGLWRLERRDRIREILPFKAQVALLKSRRYRKFWIVYTACTAMDGISPKSLLRTIHEASLGYGIDLSRPPLSIPNLLKRSLGRSSILGCPLPANS